MVTFGNVWDTYSQGGVNLPFREETLYLVEQEGKLAMVPPDSPPDAVNPIPLLPDVVFPEVFLTSSIFTYLAYKCLRYGIYCHQPCIMRTALDLADVELLGEHGQVGMSR